MTECKYIYDYYLCSFMIIFNGSPWTFIPILFPLSMTENSQMQLIVTFNHFNAKTELKNTKSDLFRRLLLGASYKKGILY